MACVWCGKQERDTLMWRNEVISLENTYFQCLWTVSHRTPRERKKNKPSELWKEQEKRKKKTPWIQCRKKHHSLQNPHNLGLILCEWVSEWVMVFSQESAPVSFSLWNLFHIICCTLLSKSGWLFPMPTPVSFLPTGQPGAEGEPQLWKETNLDGNANFVCYQLWDSEC